MISARLPAFDMQSTKTWDSNECGWGSKHSRRIWVARRANRLIWHQNNSNEYQETTMFRAGGVGSPPLHTFRFPIYCSNAPRMNEPINTPSRHTPKMGLARARYEAIHPSALLPPIEQLSQ